MDTIGFQIVIELQRLERERRQSIVEAIYRDQDDRKASILVAIGSMTVSEALQWKQARQTARLAEREAYQAESQRLAHEKARADTERRALESAAAVAAARERGIARARAELVNHAPPHAPIDTPPAPAPAAVQSEPAPAPEQRAEPVWKDGDEWTPAAVAEMERLYVQEGLSLSAIGRIMGGRVGGPAISRQRVREKIPGAVRSGKGKCKGARG